MGTYREHDPLAGILQEKHDAVLGSIKRVLAGDVPVRALRVDRQLVDALAVAEATVLEPSFARVILRQDARQLLDDCQGNRAAQVAAIDALMHSRSARVRKLRAAELIDLVQQHSERYVLLLLPVLRSQLPRTYYRALANAFSARLDEQLAGGARSENFSAGNPTAETPSAGLQPSQRRP
jgi:hypothetical protein